MRLFSLPLCVVIAGGCGKELEHTSAETASENGLWTDEPLHADRDGDGWSSHDGDCDDRNPGANPSTHEACNGFDDNCDGQIDEGFRVIWFYDLDHDGYGDPDNAEETCSGSDILIADRTDCEDHDDFIHPGAEEVCNKLDDDCNGEIDDVPNELAFHDHDLDGYGGGDAEVHDLCDDDPEWSLVGGDCKDDDAKINPGVAEICDERDNDCDGHADEDVAALRFLDHDGDGYGHWSTCMEGAGTSALGGDCDDYMAAVHPGGTEKCNGDDDDCDGVVDGPTSTGADDWYEDDDGDGYGSTATLMRDCHAPGSGWVPSGDDCDDGNADISPGHTELCDDLDNNCDGSVDEGVTFLTWHADADRDLYGDANTAIHACTAPAGYIADATDCDDAAHTIHPGASESCDALDNDCDGFIDEGVLGVSSGCPASDCSAIQASESSAASGDYFLDAGVYACEMDVSGGGWTRVQHDAVVDAATPDETAYNSEGFAWTEAMFSWSSGTMSAGCDYPADIASCNPFGFRFGTEGWAIPAHGGAALCGYSVADYSAETVELNATDFIIARAESTDEISLGAMEAVATCGVANNTGAVTMDVWVR